MPSNHTSAPMRYAELLSNMHHNNIEQPARILDNQDLHLGRMFSGQKLRPKEEAWATSRYVTQLWDCSIIIWCDGDLRAEVVC